MYATIITTLDICTLKTKYDWWMSTAIHMTIILVQQGKNP